MTMKQLINIYKSYGASLVVHTNDCSNQIEVLGVHRSMY
jgi:hypothetical protein